MRPIMLAPLAAAFVLSACGDSGADADGDGTITAQEAAAELASAPMPMRPGEWEVKMQFDDVQVPGMGEQEAQMMRSFMSNGITSTTCMTEEDIKEPDPEMFGGDNDNDCTFDQFDRRGNAVAMKLTCKGDEGGVVKTALDGEFGAEAYSMKLETNVTGGDAGNMSMKGTLTARRLGDCKDG